MTSTGLSQLPHVSIGSSQSTGRPWRNLRPSLRRNSPAALFADLVEEVVGCRHSTGCASSGTPSGDIRRPDSRPVPVKIASGIIRGEGLRRRHQQIRMRAIRPRAAVHASGSSSSRASQAGQPGAEQLPRVDVVSKRPTVRPTWPASRAGQAPRPRRMLGRGASASLAGIGLQTCISEPSVCASPWWRYSMS